MVGKTSKQLGCGGTIALFLLCAWLYSNMTDWFSCQEHEKPHELDPVAKEALATLRVFKEVYPIWIKARNEAMDEVLDCAFGSADLSNPVYEKCESRCPDVNLSDIKTESNCEEKCWESPDIDKCQTQCKAISLPSEKTHYDCLGRCYEKVGGKRTYEGRAACYDKYVQGLKPIAEQTRAKMSSLRGCEREMYGALVNGLEKAIEAKPEPLSGHPPIKIIINLVDAMTPCTERMFRCDNNPCSPSNLARLIDVVGEQQYSPRYKLFLSDGREVDRHSLTLK